MSKCRMISFLICILLLSIPWPSAGYDVKGTHQTINEKAAKSSTLDQYLKIYLDFYEGIEKSFNDKTVREWLQEGGKSEDNFPRFVWHFHDPLKPFESAGLNTSVYQFDSSVLWAQYIENDWSWQEARKHYHAGITSPSKEDRDTNLADCFRALGQVMHLLADSSVPAHVRNDIHILPFCDEPEGIPQIGTSTYETWCKYNSKKITLTSDPPDTSIFQLSDAPGLAAITNLWDTYPLTGYSPAGPIGLAEYTNYNFLSLDTVFKDYNYPTNNPSAFVCTEYTAEDGQYDYVCYYQGQTSDGKQLKHLAAAGLLRKEVEKMFEQGRIDLKATLDDNCFKEYANILVPKAIGYNAALLDYFFRGKLEMSNVIVDSIPEVDDVGTVSWLRDIPQIKVSVRNISDLGTDTNDATISEPIVNGEIVVVARYRKGADYSYSMSHPVLLDQLQIDALNSTNPSEFIFDFAPAIPAGISDLSIQVVFKGTLGNEPDNAIGVGRKEIISGALEITPPDEFVYSVIDGGISPQRFSHIKAKLKNTTSNSTDGNGDPIYQEIQDGQLYAVARYKVIPGYLEDLSNYPQDTATLQMLMDNVPYSYSLSLPITIDPLTNPISSTTANEFIFDFTDDEIPAGLTDLSLQITFEGTIGNGEDFSIAAGTIDLNEPLHFTFWNSSDEKSVYDSTLDQWVLAPNSAAWPYDFIIAFTGENPDQLNNYSRGNLPLDYDFYGTLKPVAIIENIEPATHSRLILLTDQASGNYVVVDSGRFHCSDGSFYRFFNGVQNQQDSQGNYQLTSLLPPPEGIYRGVKQHHYFFNYHCMIFNNSQECLHLEDQRSVPADLTPTPVNINFPSYTYDYVPPECSN